MRAILDEVRSADVDPETFRPQEEAFDVFCEFAVCDDDANSPALATFHIWVTSPAWLQYQVLETGSPVSGAHRIITDGWTWPAIVETLRSQVEACEGADWTALWPQLCAIGKPADGYRTD